MAVFCSTLIDVANFDTIKNNNDTIGIVRIKDSTPTVIYWKNPLNEVKLSVGETDFGELYQITQVESIVADESIVAAASIVDDESMVADEKSRVAAGDNNSDYLQIQENSKCAIHALNNLLKGEYFTTVDITDAETRIINDVTQTTTADDVIKKLDLLKNNNKDGVNLFAVSTLLQKYAPTIFGQICAANPGDSYETGIISIALNLFGYHADTFTPVDNDNNIILNNHEYQDKESPNLVGMILNTSTDFLGNGGHFIAIRRDNTHDFILVDSFMKVDNGKPPSAVTSGKIPFNNPEETTIFISNWLDTKTNYKYISNPGYIVTKDNAKATSTLNEVISAASHSKNSGGRKSSTKKRRRRSDNQVVRQRYTTKRRKSSTRKRR